ncbi:hypothetical protein J8I29_18060 [Labrys sp. LIt4]|uniref:Uncharacterized protein n=1 Tax=Labrys okinawensis TaxID=346911 RepID=A0A2S9QIX1_9HYPH|nr:MULTISPECIES: DUF6328 family protein [Labrys]MBP0581238.1 hypothetical protein [Labrys sp. LIt4]PRH89295.1 hypothetical protein C5L14_01495 [Labrys okinawensis]
MGKIKAALDESRTLMLGAQILIGFQLQAPFQNAFEHLTPSEKTIEIVVLCIMVLVLGLLVLPSAHHRIAYGGHAAPGVEETVRWATGASLLPFAAALGLDLYIAGNRVIGFTTGVAAATAATIVALGFWYGLPLLQSRQQRERPMAATKETSIGTKVEHVLTEARVVLPGAQALLGFQLAIVLTEGFERLPPDAKLLHGLALGLITLSTILLMAPAAYHRLGYRGRDTEEFHRMASRLVLAATVFLALGLCADIHVVVQKITGSDGLAHLLAGLSAALLLGLWYVLPLWHRHKRLSEERSDGIQHRTPGSKPGSHNLPT